MTDKRISDLPGISTLQGTDLGVVAQDTGGGTYATSKITIANVAIAISLLLGPSVISGGTVTASTPMINASQTWNAGGVTFTGIKSNVTNTASAAASLLLDLQVAGTSQFNVRKDGLLTAGVTTVTQLGIGMTPVNVLDITQNQNNSSLVSILNNNAGTNSYSGFSALNGTSGGYLLQMGTGNTFAGLYRDNGTILQSTGVGGLTLATYGSAQPIYFGVGGAEVARFGTDSSFLVGSTIIAGANSVRVLGGIWIGSAANAGWSSAATFECKTTNWAVSAYSTGGSGYGAFLANVDSTAANLMGLYYNHATLVGAVTTNGTITVYGTTSDAKRKTNVLPAKDSGHLIDALTVREYDWKGQGHLHPHVSHGLVAQEVEEALKDYMPWVITTTKERDGSNLKMIDHSALVPLLLHEIKSLRTRVTELEQKKAA